MIKFFRGLRQTMINQNRTTRYLLYALGEIVLVVIGILIALGINNYYNKITTQSDIKDYYVKILIELDDNINSFERKISNRDHFRAKTFQALKILENENSDSVSVLLKNIGAIRNINSVSPRFPITEEFLSQNYLAKIENDQIKSKFSEFSEMVKWIDMVDGYTINQHQTTIEPFLVENFNYSEIAMDLGDEVFFGGGPSSRIDNLWDNLKLWNVISIKLETWEYEKAALAWGLEILQTLRNLIAKELKISDER